MKSLRQLCATAALTILLTNIASAEEGVMHPWYVPPPPPHTAKMVSTGTASGGLTTTSEEPATDLATEIALSLVQSMLALF